MGIQIQFASDGSRETLAAEIFQPPSDGWHPGKPEYARPLTDR